MNSRKMKELRKKKLYVLVDVLCVFVGKCWGLLSTFCVHPRKVGYH